MASKKKSSLDWPLLVALVLVCELAGIIGGLATFSAVQDWYPTLIKPSFNPPAWVFAPVWTVLYALMGISAYLVVKKGFAKPEVRFALVIFALQLIINVKWSLLFFGLRSITGGLLTIVVLEALVLLTAWKFWKLDKNAGYLLVPYVLWVAFATLLNFALWQLNPGM